MKTLAGGILPAAVIWPLKKRPNVGGLDHRAVAADAGHRRQRVHLLRARQRARQRIDREHGRALRRQLLHQVGVLRRPDDQHAAFAHQRDFVARRAHLEHDVAAGPQLGGRGGDARAGRAIGVVVEVRAGTGAALDGHRKPQLDQFLDHLGHGRNAPFAGGCLQRNPNL
jgi:hypothetical protein